MRKSVILVMALAFAAAFAFSSCKDNHSGNNITDSGTEDITKYNVVSGGTSATEYYQEEPLYDSHDFSVPDMVTYYGYYQLSSEEKEIYNELTKRLANFDPTVPLMTDTDTFEKILELIRIEQLSFSHVSGRSSGEYNSETKMYDVNIEYRVTSEQLKKMNTEAESKAEEIMANITDDMSDYDKLKYFHNYLVINCESNSNYEYADTIYGALIKKKALCEGYAKAFSYLCNKAGIENIIVTGRTSVPHMWNMVKLDGEWYHVDVTWDKPDKNISPYCPGLVLYQYFLSTDSIVENYREIDKELFTPPEAKNSKMYYFYKENLYAKDFDSTYKILSSRIPKVKSAGKHYIMIKFDSTDIYTAVYKSITMPDDYGKCTLDYLSDDNQVKLVVTSYYSLDRIMLIVLDY